MLYRELLRIYQPVCFVGSVRENFCVDDGGLFEKQSQTGQERRL
jgi:hypothetical protein